MDVKDRPAGYQPFRVFIIPEADWAGVGGAEWNLKLHIVLI